VIQQVNLYQDTFRPHKTALAAVLIAQIVASLLLILGAVYVYSWLPLGPLEAKVAESQARIAENEASNALLRKAYPAPVVNAATKRRHEQTREKLSHTREVALKLTSGAFGSIDGLSSYLEGFARQHLDGTWLTRVRVQAGGRVIGLDGRALLPDLVPAYIGRLSQEPAFAGTAFSNMVLNADPGGLNEIGFSVRTAGLRGDE
jgi:hypothetical protein